MSKTDSETVASEGPAPGHRDLTSFQRNILTVLASEPRYGLAIKRELEDYYAEEVNHGRLYPNLDELVDEGLIEKSQLDKRTNQYALTESGFDAILDQVRWTLDRVLNGEESSERFEKLVQHHA